MVRQTTRPLFTSAPGKSILSSMRRAFKAAISIRPLDFQNISDSYAVGVFYWIFIALGVIVSRTAVKMFLNGFVNLGDVLISRVKYSLFETLFVIPVSLFYGYACGYVLGLASSSKHFTLIISSLTYLPFIVIFESNTVIFAGVDLFFWYINVYYIRSTFEAVAEYEDRRNSVLFTATVLAGWVLLLSTAICGPLIMNH